MAREPIVNDLPPEIRDDAPLIEEGFMDEAEALEDKADAEEATRNPNDRMPAGKPVAPGAAVPNDD